MSGTVRRVSLTVQLIIPHAGRSVATRYMPSTDTLYAIYPHTLYTAGVTPSWVTQSRTRIYTHSDEYQAAHFADGECCKKRHDKFRLINYN
jgi:hypothetical protein